LKIIRLIKDFNPKLVIALTIIVVTWVNFNITFWQSKKVIEYDVAFYYSYLPSVFYYHDISQNFLKDTVNQNIEKNYFVPSKLKNGDYVFKSTMGMALSYLPFFTAAHIFAKVFNYEVNGYSEPYHFAIQFSSLFYFIFGLLFLIKTLQLYFTDIIVSLVLICIIFGTNTLYYLTIGAGMSHAVNFGLISAFVYYTIKWHQRASFKHSILIGLIGGMLTLIRPINILIFLFFFLYNIKSAKDLLRKSLVFFKYKIHVLTIALLGILICLPQLIYWKYQTGSWFFNSYVGEHFYFKNPHILYGLFSFRKGWLIYTPIMAFALIGIYYLYKTMKEFFIPASALILIYLYVAFSWWCWWYGGSYGQRSLIDIYPVLALPFAAFLFHLHNSSVLKKSVSYSLMIMFILLNIFQTMQAKWNTIHFDSMTKEAYFDAFLRLTKNPEREKFLKHPDIEKAKAGLEEY